ncbi:MAG: SDR family oxidoreductase, partial [Anaerolineae bacterium]|nr:SDR family oxidoreductase [Anaerolineae bacterium]
MDIKGKVVLITGASMGIGLSTARLFAAGGARVALAARSTDKLTALADELRHQGHEALVLTTDMRDPVAVKSMVDASLAHFGSLDILINNAGQAAAGTVAEVDPLDFQKIIELNVFGPLYAMQAAIPTLRRQGGGIIINISSMVSKMHIPGLGAYAATKTALNMLSDTARGELAADNIR